MASDASQEDHGSLGWGGGPSSASSSISTPSPLFSQKSQANNVFYIKCTKLNAHIGGHEEEEGRRQDWEARIG